MTEFMLERRRRPHDVRVAVDVIKGKGGLRRPGGSEKRRKTDGKDKQRIYGRAGQSGEDAAEVHEDDLA